MDYSFAQYLLAKQTVDDRALNKDVVQTLRVHLPAGPVSVIEVGAGVGTMLKRLIDWGLLCTGEYVLVDEQQEIIHYAKKWIPQWATEEGFSVETIGENILHLRDQTHDIRIRLECADVFDFIQCNQTPADVLIAHTFLDLLPLPKSLEKLFSLTHGLAWFTINFDGMSTLQPFVDPGLDEKIERLYHASMDTRLTSGDSRTGRKLFQYLQAMNAEILAAGASDWVVYAKNGKYPADEKFFLQFILHFFESSLKGCQELEASEFQGWLTQRHAQLERGELVYIAHQMDFLAEKHAR